MYLYDMATGGAGYASKIPTYLPRLLNQTREALNCPRQCDTACQSCLLTHDTQHHLADLHRHKALELLSDRFLTALELTGNLRAFGSETQLEMEPLRLAVHREWQRQEAHELRIYLGGKALHWEPLAWRLRGDLIRWQKAGIVIRLIVPAATLKELSNSQRDELAALIAYTGAAFYCAPDVAMASQLPLVLELGGKTQRVQWAAYQTSALVPCPTWGSGEWGGPFVRVVESQSLSPLPETWAPITTEKVRPNPRGLVVLSMTSELNGTLNTFGKRVWELLGQHIPALAQRLNGDIPLQSVHYSDRYLRSPFIWLLLYHMLNDLARYRGGLAVNTVVRVNTARLDRERSKPPLLISHDWQDAVDRKEVVRNLFKAMSTKFELYDEKPASQLQHARELKLVWSDRQHLTLRPDQGFGYWRPERRKEFPFNHDVDRQLLDLQRADVMVESVSHNVPTYWYVAI